MDEQSATGTQYLLYLPDAYSPEGQPWPLVVYLHGSGLRGRDLDLVASEGPPRLAREGEPLPFILASPQCPQNQSFDPKMVRSLVEHVVEQHQIEREKIYLTGYSMGGFGTWQAAAAYPDLFAAFAPLCGGGNPDEAESLAQTPVWAFHGDQDKVVPLEQTTLMTEAVTNAGGEVTLSILPGMGHAICDDVYSDRSLFDWLLTHRKRVPLEAEVAK
ncbi:carboxylesterase family protein [Posidoniimonas corsicana]|nr:prolyl oligopeptidase family serine peptidase [Posidoniimonas corsicana]